MKKEILNRNYEVNDILDGFNVNIANSTSIAFFGSNLNTGSMFIQFNNGNTYIYQDITPEVRKGFWNASSVGSYYSKSIKNRFPSIKLEGKGVCLSESIFFV